ncbi:MAG: hypothetical protein O4861_19510 [Trichodesmium sp. St16_bin4-tuft]|nr:hypothetical protein [Trichodesmium sp. St4_bin8_1]MDE5071153.1 hypothetical protein [Trichodesmium sp. St5_bin8]MDE5100395.1 hypothetical protein [Trichodesmium sp. St16_bin4-tuft]MDE5102051.1 hypothetical protein [Trichodesmium sp. St19_bin2]
MTTNSPKKSKDEMRIDPDLIKKASRDDRKAIITMFQQFIPEAEEIYFAGYLGLQGLWGFGNREFACLTDRRVADITVGRFGKITYQDGYLEHINSTFIYQPSKLWLYLTGITYLLLLAIIVFAVTVGIGSFFTDTLDAAIIIGILLAAITGIFTLGIGLFLLSFIIQIYYRLFKCGIVIAVRGGMPVYIFTNRRLLTRANELIRRLTIAREKRIKLRGVV